MKKITSLLLLVCTIAGIGCFSVTAQAVNIENASPLLAELKIMQGDPDGNLRLDAQVTRAECTKIAVACSKYRDTVALGSKTSPFRDVSAEHWAAPYITVGVKNGICKGYLDATFRPQDLVLHEEALTMLLRVLGYSEEDFGSSWPDGQLGLSRNIGLSDGVLSQRGEAASRRDVMMMVYNLLNIPPKGGQNDYIAEFDRTIIDDVVLIATAKEDSSVGAGKIHTSAGTYKLTDKFDYNNVGKRGSISLRNNDTVVSFVPNEQSVEEYTVTNTVGTDILFGESILDIDNGTPVYFKSKSYTYESVTSEIDAGDTCRVFKGQNGEIDYVLFTTTPKSSSLTSTAIQRHVVYSVLGNSVITYRNGSFDSVDLSQNSVFYDDDTPSSYNAIMQKLSMGDVLTLRFKDNGTVSYVVYEEGATVGPVTVNGASWQNALGVTEDSVSIMRDGAKASRSDVKTNDIAYYSKDLNMILVYSKKVTGIYESATPNTDAPSSVTVSGVTYSLEGVEAFSKLSSGGSFRLGDTVTLLLGKSGEVADVLTQGQLSDTVYGFLTATGTKKTNVSGTTITKPYVRVVLSSGETAEYITTKQYDNLKNQPVKVSLKDGDATVSAVTTSAAVSGQFTWNGNNRSLGNTKLDNSLQILEVSTTNSDESGKTATVFPQRLNGAKIDSGDVLYAKKNSEGYLTELILRDTTGDMHDYGIVTEAEKNTNGINVSGVYTCMINGTEQTIAKNGTAYTVSAGQAVKLKTAENGEVTGITALTRLTGGKISDATQSEVIYGGKTYRLSDKVSIYVKQSYRYSMLTTDQWLENYQNYQATLYCDSTGTIGRVRVIVVTPNV